MESNIDKLTLDCNWQDLTEGMQIYGSKTSEAFNTGEWSANKPEIDESKCVQCLMCVPVCPDSCIPVVNGLRGAFDLDHCKGCGICVKNCHVGAITLKGVE